MKKFKISIMAILLCSALLFAGCTKADNATLKTIGILYDGIATQYGQSEQGKTKVFDEDGRVDLYSNSSLSDKLYGLVIDQTEDSSKNIFNIISNGFEYQSIMEGLTDFYGDLGVKTNLQSEISQDKLTKIYQKIEDSKNSIADLYNVKLSLETMLDNQGVENANKRPVQASFEDFVQAYKKVMDKLYQVNKAYEEMHTSCLLIYQTETQKVPSSAYKTLLYSSELYLAEYYYQKQLILNEDTDNRFAHQKIYNTTLEQYEDNPNYDKNFEGYKNIVNKINDGIANLDDATASSADTLAYYNAYIKKLATFKTNVENYKTAVQKILEYKKSHNGSDVPQSDANYYYVQFVEMMDTEVANIQNYLSTNILSRV